MTVIRKVAIIGGGPAGLIAANDLTRQRDQNWEIVGFEARQSLGGVWSDNPGTHMEAEQVFPQLGSLDNLEGPLTPSQIFQYDSPLVVNGRIANLRPLLTTSEKKPMQLTRRSRLRDGVIMSKKSGLYDDFMTNAPGQLMKLNQKSNLKEKKMAPQTSMAPLVDLAQVKEQFQQFEKHSQSAGCFRLNTCVEYLDKLSPSKWIIVAKRSLPGAEHEEWYSETFDAVVVANGHFMCPYVPFYMTAGDSNVHEFNKNFPNTLVHVRDLDHWYRKSLPALKQDLEKAKRKVVIVGKSFSAMDVLKRLVPLHNANSNLEIIISTNTPPFPENSANPFCWFDKWLTETNKVTLKGRIAKFGQRGEKPILQFKDGSVVEDVSAVIFATGYLYTFPFISRSLLESYRILVSPNPNDPSGSSSNASRVSGLYLHTFSIADPTLAFVGISSNANFQSFSISSQAIAGVWSKFNRLFDQLQPQDSPIYDSIWSQVLPCVQEQLSWAKERLSQTGNNGAYHFYYPLQLLESHWLRYCKPLFPTEDKEGGLFPANSAELSQKGLRRLQELFYQAVDPR
ncbi:LADA_0B07888g1_1 [Lachancea dasiensis]|uniref:LADA_0B07888g1_1 n=1 Tax=Lachancea dasiensis TaxID=1072105 RepID=A0A1G4IUQ9_9SACH|nr:LADA_0B07888g1_1 [Lachancea dasiensis]